MLERSSALVLLLASISVPQAADAFVCTQLESGTTQAWLSRCIPYAISCQNDQLLDPNLEAIIHRSFRVWQDVECSDMTFNPIGYAPELERFLVQAPRDNFNTIGAVTQNAERVFGEPNLLALTFTHFAVETGEILDADILLNAAQFEFVDTTQLSACDRRSNVFDLENTMVHEIGHLIGFDHVQIEEATMFPSAEACEVDKRDLAADDISAICSVYPTGGGPSTCQPPPIDYDQGSLDATGFRNHCALFESNMRTSFNQMMCIENRGGGCTCTNAKTRTSALWLLSGLLLFWVRRRRAA